MKRGILATSIMIGLGLTSTMAAVASELPVPNDQQIVIQDVSQLQIAPAPVSSAQKQRDKQFEQQTLKAGVAYVKAAGDGFNRIKFSDNYTALRMGNEGEQSNLPYGNSNFDPANTNFWNLVVNETIDGKHAHFTSVGSNVFLSSPFAKLTPGVEYLGSAMNKLRAAYPDMSVRDLRDLLARNATRIDADQQPARISYTTADGKIRRVTALEGWERNKAGLWFSPSYGFGVMDLNKALASAATHTPLPPLVQLPAQTVRVSANAGVIPDVGSGPTVSATHVDRNLIVEAVQVNLNLDHQRFSDLLVELVSPSGTRSVLINPYNGLVGQAFDSGFLKKDASKQLRDMRLLSNKFYGERSSGQWRLEVTDVSKEHRGLYFYENEGNNIGNWVGDANNSQPGQLISWSLRVLGHDSGEAYQYIFPESIKYYEAGTKVLQPKTGKVYQCNPFPYSGYCLQWSTSAIQYEPGIGANWKDAWTELN